MELTLTGHFIVASIYGRNYDGQTGFVTNIVQYSGIGPAKFTMATSPVYYIDAGSLADTGTELLGLRRRLGRCMRLRPRPPTPVPTLNEWGMILLSLAMGVAALFYMKRRQRDAD